MKPFFKEDGNGLCRELGCRCRCFWSPVTCDWGATDLMLKGIKKMGAKPERRLAIDIEHSMNIVT